MISAGPFVAVVLLVGVLGFAVARPRGLPEVVAAVPAAVVVVVVGAVNPAGAWAEVTALLPVVAFLAAVLVLAHLCDAEGLFAAAGALMARDAHGRPQRLLVAVFVVASVVTALLSLDATVVLLTPVVFATAARAGVRPKPFVYACTHLANSASVLLPVSNLTNLLAFTASGLSFAHFTELIGLRDGPTRGHSRHGWCSPDHLTCALRPRDGSVGSACWTDRTDRSRASAFPSLTMQVCQIAVSVAGPPGDLLGACSSEGRCGRARHPRSRSLRSKGSPLFRLTP